MINTNLIFLLFPLISSLIVLSIAIWSLALNRKEVNIQNNKMIDHLTNIDENTVKLIKLLEGFKRK